MTVHQSLPQFLADVEVAASEFRRELDRLCSTHLFQLQRDIAEAAREWGSVMRRLQGDMPPGRRDRTEPALPCGMRKPRTMASLTRNREPKE